MMMVGQGARGWMVVAVLVVVVYGVRTVTAAAWLGPRLFAPLLPLGLEPPPPQNSVGTRTIDVIT
jgi:hypothetical protein